MSERTKVLTLATLISLLVLLGVYQFVIRKPRPQVKPASTSAAKPDETTDEKPELPNLEDMKQLGTWLNTSPVDESHDVKGRFGVDPAEEEPKTQTQTVEVTGWDDTLPPTIPPLIGIMTVQGELKAIIGGRTYARGDAVAGSDYHIADITSITVIFQDSQGRRAKVKLLQ